MGPTYRNGDSSSFGDGGVGSSREFTDLTATEDVTEDMVDLVVCAPVGVLGVLDHGGS